ncbi:MAG: hypothetical protein ACXW2T_06575 [Allosphingosinicella sp.]
MQHTRSLIAAMAAALVSLSACDRQPETLEAPGVADPQAQDLAQAKPVELPPAIQASRTYRCKDNSLVYIDFYTNNTARVRSKKGGEAVIVSATEAGQAMVADGYSVSGNSPQISYTAPGKGTQSCKA